jgi:hypothetical protein
MRAQKSIPGGGKATIRKYPAIDGQATTAGMLSLTRRINDQMCFVGLGGVKMGATGHAVGLDRWSKPGHTFYFDPNMGEVVLSDALFVTWLDDFWPLFGYEEKYGTFTATVFDSFLDQPLPSADDFDALLKQFGFDQ